MSGNPTYTAISGQQLSTVESLVKLADRLLEKEKQIADQRTYSPFRLKYSDIFIAAGYDRYSNKKVIDYWTDRLGIKVSDGVIIYCEKVEMMIEQMQLYKGKKLP